MLYTLVEHALSTNDSARHIRTLLLFKMVAKRSNAMTQQTQKFKSNCSFRAITEASSPTQMIIKCSDSVLTYVARTKSTQKERNVSQPTYICTN